MKQMRNWFDFVSSFDFLLIWLRVGRVGRRVGERALRAIIHCACGGRRMGRRMGRDDEAKRFHGRIRHVSGKEIGS